MGPRPEATARRPRPALIVLAGHIVLVACLFPALLFQGQVPYFRDLASHYFPSFVLLSRAVGQGIAWPLWNPWTNAGEPFLDPYPVDLLLVRLAGPMGALRLDAPLHVLVAMCGLSACARRRGASFSAAWAAGAFFGAGGFVLSSANSLQFFHAVCWAPAVLAAFLGVVGRGRRSDVALLGLAAAVQVSTMGADVVMQTGLLALFLWPHRPRPRELARLGAAGLLAVLLAAPALLGTMWALEGTRRSAGFSAAEVLSYSAAPVVLMESVLPRLLGDVHTFSDYGYWGQSFFESGYPYFVSLYLGPCVLLLAILGCRGTGWRRLLVVAVLGVLLALGAYGPLARLIPLVLHHFRYPVKFFLLVHLPVCLLAARGLDSLVERRPPLLRFAPAVLLAAVGVVAALAPTLPGSLLGPLVPALRDPRALVVISLAWPVFFLRTAGLAAALALSLGLRRSAPLAAGIAALDLVLVNAPCHPATTPDFYTLQPGFREAVTAAATQGPYRWFSFGVSNTPGVTFHPKVAATNSDVFLYYADRQSLWGSAHVIDGIETAYQEEHSFAPAGATLSIEERQPARFREFAERLRLANVRWIASFQELPADLVAEVRRIPFPEIVQPLRMYELRGSLPRAYWTPTLSPFDVVLPGTVPPGGSPAVSVAQPDLQTIAVRADTPPGFVVLVEGHNSAWRAVREGATVPLLRVNGRYMAVATPGGPQAFTLRLEPRWRAPALGAMWAGLLMVGGVLLAETWRRLSPDGPDGARHA